MILPELDKMSLQQVGASLDAKVEHEVIDCVNWKDQFPYKPFTAFVIAASATRLYVFFSVISKDLLAVNTQDLSPVANDSCVEFFMKLQGHEEYWNFEFNCIGTLNASHRVERSNPIRLTAEQLEQVERYASCGRAPINEPDGIYCWDLTVSIPLSLVGLDSSCLPDYILGNFYKCSGKSAHKHYVSWNEIDSDKPDFHRPDCFGKLWFRQPTNESKIPVAQSQLVKTEDEGLLTKLKRFFKKS